MLNAVWGKVVVIEEETSHIQYLKVRFRKHNEDVKDAIENSPFNEATLIDVINYKNNHTRCALGDWVQVNTSAIDLNLGTGGYGFVMGILHKHDYKNKRQYTPERPIVSRHQLDKLKYHKIDEHQTEYSIHHQDSYHSHSLNRCTKREARQKNYPGHIMKLRYSPFQTAVQAIEAPESEHHEQFLTTFSLQNKPILVGELHSMLPVIASLVHNGKQTKKIAYIMDDQACLQANFSRHIVKLQKETDLTCITYGQATGGDIECVNLYTALEAAEKVVQADCIIVTQGPGVLGTGTVRGYSGMQLAQWLHAIHTCEGQSIVIPRIHFADHRSRHHGFSHHFIYPLLKHTLVRVHVPYPIINDAYQDEMLQQHIPRLQKKHDVHPIPIEQFEKKLTRALQWYGEIKTMGKTFADDPAFYYGIGAAFHCYESIVQDL